MISKNKEYRQQQKELNSLLIKKEKYTNTIKKITNDYIKIRSETKKIKLEHIRVKEKINSLNKEKKIESYNLNKNKVTLQQVENPYSYKVLAIYLTATTVIGILLAVYYIFFYSKG